MKKLLILALLFPLSAFAQHGPHGGPGGPGGPGGVHIGIGFSGYYGPRYYGPAYYYPYAYGPYYDYPPTVVYTQPDVVVQAPPPAYWYYCDSANAYYPYVRQCPEGWRAVPASAPAQTSQNEPAPPPATAPAPQGAVTFSLGDVLFDSGSATLKIEAAPVLDSVVAALNNDPGRRIVVSGHTDNVGDAAANLALSSRRAEAVKNFLVAHGIAEGRIEAVGRGASEPLAGNGDSAGRQRNRRVDITVS